MNEVTIRELQNRVGEVLRRVTEGESLTVTRDGQPVAELRPLPRRPVPAATLLNRWRSVQPIDGGKLRDDIDAVLNSSL